MRRRASYLLLALALAVVAGWAFWRIRQGQESYAAYRSSPEGVMGTRCSLVVVQPRNHATAARRQLALAEAELRRLEALLSNWIEASQISRFNSAPIDTPIPLSPEVLEVLRSARQLHEETAGAFDITARPLIEVWRRAGEDGELPAESVLAQARAGSSWRAIELHDDQALKTLSTARVDVDGIAKGYAIDRALLALRRAGADGGMVEIGGDLRLFGVGPDDGSWLVAIRSPFEDRPWAEIRLDQGAVCSSGDYARFIEIGGRRYSHIVDPRSGSPAAGVTAVTVVGSDAATADAWATALSVLGINGLERLTGTTAFEAMLVSGTSDDFEVHATPGFRQLMVSADFELEVSPTTRTDRPWS